MHNIHGPFYKAHHSFITVDTANLIKFAPAICEVYLPPTVTALLEHVDLNKVASNQTNLWSQTLTGADLRISQGVSIEPLVIIFRGTSFMENSTVQR